MARKKRKKKYKQPKISRRKIRKKILNSRAKVRKKIQQVKKETRKAQRLLTHPVGFDMKQGMFAKKNLPKDYDDPMGLDFFKKGKKK